MGKKSTPKAPDYVALAEQQAQSDKENTTAQTWANRPNLTTPWGEQTWEASRGTDPTTGQPITEWSSNISLSPDQQAALDSEMAIQKGRADLAGGMMDRVSNEFSPTMDWDNMPEITPFSYGGNVKSGPIVGSGAQVSYENLPGLTDASQLRKKIEDARYGSATSRLDPQWNDREEALKTELYNKGFKEGDEGFVNALRDFNFNRTDAYDTAMRGALTDAGSEVSRQAGVELANRGQLAGERTSAAQIGNQAAGIELQGQIASARQALDTNEQNFGQARDIFTTSAQQRQQAISEEMQRRGFTLNEINALLSGQQVGLPEMPSFQNSGKAAATQYMDAGKNQYQAELDAYNARNAMFQGILSGVTSPFSFNFGS